MLELSWVYLFIASDDPKKTNSERYLLFLHKIYSSNGIIITNVIT